MPRSFPPLSVPVPPSRRRMPLRHFRCPSCGYSAARRAAPARCPLCGSLDWIDETAKPEARSIFPGVPLS